MQLANLWLAMVSKFSPQTHLKQIMSQQGADYLLNHLLVPVHALLLNLGRNCVQSALCVDMSASFILYCIKFRQKAGQVEGCEDFLRLNNMIAYF